MGNIQRDLGFNPFINILHRIFNYSQVTQPQEVELDQTSGFNVIFIVLGHPAGAIGIAQYRREVGNFGRCNDHTTGVFTGISGNAFEL